VGLESLVRRRLSLGEVLERIFPGADHLRAKLGEEPDVLLALLDELLTGSDSGFQHFCSFLGFLLEGLVGRFRFVQSLFCSLEVGLADAQSFFFGLKIFEDISVSSLFFLYYGVSLGELLFKFTDFLVQDVDLGVQGIYFV